MPEPLKFDSPLQERVYQRLHLVGPGAAAFFADACRMMVHPSRLETTHHLVGHCVREIESALRDVLNPTRGQAADATRDGAARKKGRERTDASDGVSRGKNNKLREVQHILSDLGIPETDPAAVYWLATCPEDSPDALHRHMHRDNLGPARPVDEDFIASWERMQRLLDVLLDRFESRYAEVYDRLDGLIAEDTPTAAVLDELTKRLPYTPATHRHLFGRLSSPKWVEPLRERGFFKSPPPPQEHEAGIRFPDWAQADYLERIAELAPTEVRDIIESVETQNVRVQARMVEIALKLPPDEALKLLPRVQPWVTDLMRFDLYEPVVRFAEHLANGGHGAAAIQLTGAIYGLQGINDE